MKLKEARGHWALVTGASAGIGLEFCRQLAKAGMNIVMVARRERNLSSLANEIKDQFSVSTLAIPLDLSQPNATKFIKEKLETKGIKIRLLCNNAAITSWCLFETIDDHEYEKIIQLNITSIVTLCDLLLPDLQSRPSSVVINLSSGAAF